MKCTEEKGYSRLFNCILEQIYESKILINFTKYKFYEKRNQIVAECCYLIIN